MIGCNMGDFGVSLEYCGNFGGLYNLNRKNCRKKYLSLLLMMLRWNMFVDQGEYIEYIQYKVSNDIQMCNLIFGGDFGIVADFNREL